MKEYAECLGHFFSIELPSRLQFCMTIAMKCPQLLPSLVIADDARLAAQVSCVLARPRTYLPVVDGPRLTRLDHEAEVIRRNNAAARVKPSSIVFAGLTDDAGKALLGRLPSKLVTHISQPSGIQALPQPADGLRAPSLTWGRDRIGIGLLKALRARTNIEFLDAPSPIESVSSKSGHLVVCEAGEE